MWPTYQLHEQITKTLTNIYTNGARHIYSLRNIQLKKKWAKLLFQNLSQLQLSFEHFHLLAEDCKICTVLIMEFNDHICNVNTHQHFIKKSVCKCRTYLHTKYDLPAFNHWLHITETWNLNKHLAQPWCFPSSKTVCAFLLFSFNNYWHLTDHQL
jgi:hypothetical protein